jgi:hypothetical protein
MRVKHPLLAVVVLTTLSLSANAADCRRGTLTGSKSPSAPPEENIQCRVMGRIFCSVSDYRNSDVDREPAVARTAEWLSHLGQTGSHISGNYKPAVDVAATYIYAHDKMPPWTAYQYAVFTCGVNQRIEDAAVREKIAEPWEAVAQECLKQFPGEGDGSGNEKLKRCLRGAMDTVVKGTKVAKK